MIITKRTTATILLILIAVLAWVLVWQFRMILDLNKPIGPLRIIYRGE